MGAGVPRPCSAKRANASTSPGTPARIIIAPMPRVSSRPRNGGRSCQPVIDHGTSPASVHGATTKKTAEPRTAMVRCTAVPDTLPTSPSWFPVVIRVPTRSPCYPKSGNRARLKPECHGGNEAQGREVVPSEFIVARCDAPEVLEPAVAALDDVAIRLGLLRVTYAF